MNVALILMAIAFGLFMISTIATVASIVYHCTRRRDNRIERAIRYLEELNTAPWEVET